jgi:4-hydroxybenzoate polyprenyltransferase
VQDKHDDQKIGIRSTALLFGDRTPLLLSGFAGTSVAGLALAGGAAGLAWPYYAALAAFGGHMAWQVGAPIIKNDGSAYFGPGSSVETVLGGSRPPS